MITFKDVFISYGKNIVIKGISFNVKQGEIFGILGPNGSGKTTLLRAMLGIINPDRGEILIDGINPSKVKPKIAAIFETSVGAEFLRLTPREDLRFYSALYDVDVTDEKIREILEMVDLDPNKKLYAFSRGMWQKLYIARALIPDFPVIALDEPWLGLDVSMQRKTVEILKSLKKTFILTAHEMPLAERACDKIMIINNGKKVVEGAPNELLNQMEWRYKVKITGSNEEVKTYYVKDLASFLQKIKMNGVYKIDISPVSLEDAYLTFLK